LPKRLLRIFHGKTRVPATALPKAKPAGLSPMEVAARNYVRMHHASMARDRRSIDGR